MNKTTSMNGALILIAIALVGAGVSYHLTLESRFALIEQKLEQNSLALQQFQISQETLASSKIDMLNNLNKEVDALQASLAPLGKTTHEQTDSLSAIHKQIASLQQAQQAQQDAEKRLADYAAQLEKTKHEIVGQTAQMATQAPVASPAASLAVAPPEVALPVAHAVVPAVALPVTPRADSAVDIRADQSTAVVSAPFVRALPVALPVALSSNVR
jgi:predicted phage tail protein